METCFLIQPTSLIGLNPKLATAHLIILWTEQPCNHKTHNHKPRKQFFFDFRCIAFASRFFLLNTLHVSIGLVIHIIRHILYPFEFVPLGSLVTPSVRNVCNNLPVDPCSSSTLVSSTKAHPKIFTSLS
ncbi:hypothetical protein ACHQM5_030050 [Ranunculus cassubicifolius]